MFRSGVLEPCGQLFKRLARMEELLGYFSPCLMVISNRFIVFLH